MTKLTKSTIWIDREAYFFLNRESRKQRGCVPMNKEQEERYWNRMKTVNGKREVDKDSFGGGDGTYNGKWWGWSLETVKQMLDDGGFQYEEGREVEYINVYI